jgi:hypothetical protein
MVSKPRAKSKCPKLKYGLCHSLLISVKFGISGDLSLHAYKGTTDKTETESIL